MKLICKFHIQISIFKAWKILELASRGYALLIRSCGLKIRVKYGEYGGTRGGNRGKGRDMLRWPRGKSGDVEGNKGKNLHHRGHQIHYLT